jgi:hypothetical protein
MANDPSDSPTSFPVSVLMERKLGRSGPWSAYQWSCVAVVAGQDMVEGEAGITPVSDDGEQARFMYSGLNVSLFKDGCESYWYNLQSETPYLFVICHHDEVAEDESMAVEPVIVSANQDEANAHMESEDLVFSVPMPDRVIDWLERYVVEHYDPVIKKKRKRRNWAEESEDNAKSRRPDRFH